MSRVGPKCNDPFSLGMCPYGLFDLLYTRYNPKFKKSILLKVPSLEILPPTWPKKKKKKKIRDIVGAFGEVFL